jgi:hypothetical protein
VTLPLLDSKRTLKVKTFHDSNSITPTMAETLLIIWEITGKNNSKIIATRKVIEALLKQKGKNIRVSSVLADLNSLPGQKCIESFKAFETDKDRGVAKQGQPPIAYCFHAEMVTLPQTAIILLELMSFSPSENYLIYQDKFVEHIYAKYQWEKDFIKNRIIAATLAGYIITSKITSEKDSLWGSVRIKREWEFLLLLSKQVLNKTPKGDTSG